MAGFGAKERFIAKMLSAFPGVKQTVKKIYIQANALVYKKGYIEKVYWGNGSIEQPWKGCEETFFGYYDKSPENSRGDVLIHLTDYNTRYTPSAAHSIKIGIIYKNGTQEIIGETSSYNWQQGARAMWLNDDLVVYNVYEDGGYKTIVYSIGEKKVVKVFDRPVQEVRGTDYFLSINYRRIMAVRPDYGYRNMPPLSVEELNAFDDAGILKVDYATGEETELISMDEIVKVNPKVVFASCIHVVNHLMLSPGATGLVFVHRFYEGKRRHDRLMYYNFKELKCVLDDDMVSHYCWLDEEHLFGYVRVGGTDGFYTINVKTGEAIPCEALNRLHNGDGHPSYNNGRIVVDTYPDKSRMQHLMVLDVKTQEMREIVEVYQSVKYMNETRCDMHPRLVDNGKTVYFDSVYNGKRQLCKFELK